MRTSEPIFSRNEMRVVLWVLVAYLTVQLAVTVFTWSDQTIPRAHAAVGYTTGVAEAQPLDAGS